MPITDKENIRKMLNKAKIEFKEEITEITDDFIIERGYIGFYTTISFDENNNLLDITAYE